MMREFIIFCLLNAIFLVTARHVEIYNHEENAIIQSDLKFVLDLCDDSRDVHSCSQCVLEATQNTKDNEVITIVVEKCKDRLHIQYQDCATKEAARACLIQVYHTKRKTRRSRREDRYTITVVVRKEKTKNGQDNDEDNESNERKNLRKGKIKKRNSKNAGRKRGGRGRRINSWKTTRRPLRRGFSRRSKGGLSRRPKGGLSRRPKGRLSRRPKGGLSRRPQGGLSRRPKGALSRRPKGGLSRRPQGGLSGRPKGGLSRRPQGGLSRRPKGGLSRRPQGGGGFSRRPNRGSSRIPNAGYSGRPEGGYSRPQGGYSKGPNDWTSRRPSGGGYNETNTTIYPSTPRKTDINETAQQNHTTTFRYDSNTTNTTNNPLAGYWSHMTTSPDEINTTTYSYPPIFGTTDAKGTAQNKDFTTFRYGRTTNHGINTEKWKNSREAFHPTVEYGKKTTNSEKLFSTTIGHLPDDVVDPSTKPSENIHSD